MVAMGKSGINNYEYWQKLSLSQLEDLSVKFDQADKPDSAFAVLSIMANRYNTNHKLSKEDILHCIVGMHNMGVMYMNHYYDFEKACNCLLQAIDVAKSHHLDKEYAMHSKITLATINSINHDICNDYQFRADDIENFKRAYIESKRDSLWIHMSTCILNMSLRLCSPKSAGHETLLSPYIQDFLLSMAPDTIPEVHLAHEMARGMQHFIAHDYENALSLFECMLQNPNLSDIYGDQGFTAVYYLIANTHMRAGHGQQAVQAIEQLLQFSKERNLQDGILDAYFSLFMYYQSIGDNEQTTHYRLLYLEQKDRFINKFKLGDIDKSQFLYQLEKANENVKELSYKRQMQSRLLWVLAAFTLLLFVFLFSLWRNYRRTRLNNKQLYDKYQKALASDSEKKRLIEQLSKVSEQPSSTPEKYLNSPMNDMEKDNLLQRIFVVLDSNNEIFDEAFSLSRLAELVDAKPNYVSQVINERHQCNFPTLLAEYRIKEACRRMKDTAHYGNQTIEAIAASVGFKSRSHFTTVFKRVTGISPSVYQKLSQND